MANFKKAMEWLEKGKKIKRTNWRIDGDVHLFLKNIGEEFKILEVFDSYGKPYRFDWNDIKTKQWVLYKSAPKQD